MPYVSRTQEEILAELQSWSGIDASKIEGTFEYDVLSSNAVEFAKLEAELAEAYKISFGHTTWGEYLELRASESGVIRRNANRAVGKLSVIGNGKIFAGSVFSTLANTRFLAANDYTVNDSAIIDIIAEKPGSAGNVAANSIIKIPMNIAGIRSCFNPEKTFDGFDEEDDESLRDRYLTKVRYPATSGNPRQYIEWAMSIVGVGTARCQRCWNGPGTVKVVIADSDLNEANVLLLQRVFDFIEQERPIGAEVSVVSAKIIPINVKAKISGALDVDSFKSAATNYFKKMTHQTLFNYSNAGSYESFTGDLFVSIAQINSFLIANGGADDVQNLTLNGLTGNFPLNIDEIPKLGSFERA